MNWNLFLFFSIYSFLGILNEMHTIFCSLTSKLPLSFFLSASLHPAPCIGVPQLSASGFTHSFVFLNAAFPRATALLLYHIFSSLSRGFSKLFLNFSWFSSKSTWFRGFSLTAFQQLIHYITFFLICQEVFQNFFCFFLTHLFGDFWKRRSLFATA